MNCLFVKFFKKYTARIQILANTLEALKALQQDDGGTTQSYRPVTREKTVSLADCCALYRLKTILKAMHELLDVQASLDKSVFLMKSKGVLKLSDSYVSFSRLNVNMPNGTLQMVRK